MIVPQILSTRTSADALPLSTGFRGGDRRVGGFQPTKQGNPCILCGDTKGKCRETDTDLILCMTLEQQAGFKSLGLTKNSTWTMFVPDTGETSAEQREQQRRDWQARREQRAAAEAQRQAEAIPAAERDRHYRQLLSQLTLHPADRADLEQRGYTPEQIKAAGYKSVEQWQRLEFELPHTLPGVSIDGRSLTNSVAGYLCPAINADGLIVGFQVRRREDGPSKARWLSSYSSEHRPHGPQPKTKEFNENPLTVHPNGPQIALAEGIGAKPSLASIRTGCTVIGAAGGQWASSPATFKATLEKLGATPGQTITLFTDSGDRDKPGPMRRWQATAELLQQWGYSVRVWTGSADIDEVPPAELEQLRFISLAEFFDHPLPRSTPQPGEISRDRFEFLQWVKSTYNRAAYRFARDHGHLPENPQLKPGQSLAITPPGFWDENNAFVTRGLKRSVYNCTPETVPTVPHWEAMGKPRLFFTSDPAKCLERMAGLGYRDILADDVTGGGKSKISGELMQSWQQGGHNPETEKAIYYAPDYKNPSTLTLESIPETPTGGAMDFDKAHKTEGGNWHRKRSQSPRPDIAALCIEDSNIQAARAKGVNIYRGAESETCQGCTKFRGCPFLSAQRKAHGETALRSHLDKGGKGAIAIVDESGVSIGSMRKVEAKPSDITLERGLIAYRDKATGEAAADVLNQLQQALERAIEERGIHGLTHAELLPMLPTAEALEAKLFDAYFDTWTATDDPWGYPLLGKLAQKINKAVQPELSEIFDGRDGAESRAEAIRDQVSPGILPRLLRIISGKAGDVAVSGGGGLAFTYRNRRNQYTLANFKTRIFLDSTPDVVDLARKVGGKAEDFCRVGWTAPRFDNLTIKVVKGIGKAGQQRRDETEFTEQQRINALVLEICDRAGDAPIGLLDLKRYSSIYESLGLDALGHQFAHSRGSNEFKSCEQMVIVAGNAKANLGQLLSEWHCLTGESSTVKTASAAFWAWSDRKATANLLQANGRTRAQHRPHQAITHWLVGDSSQADRAALEMLYPGCMVEEVQAYDITPAAASQGYRSDRAIVEAMWQLTTEGEAATIDQVSAAAGLAKSTISERVKAFDIGGFKALRKSSGLLYKALNNNPELFEEAGELPIELLELAREFLPALADELEQGRSAADVAADYLSIFEVYGAAAFRRMLDAAPAGTMARLYESREFREAIENDTGPGLLGAIAAMEVA